MYIATYAVSLNVGLALIYALFGVTLFDLQ